jgi:hypothetical protein
MPLQNSGQISLNDLHVEAGGTSGTQCSMNDSDIRGLLNASANSQMTFSGFYGASNALWTTDVTVGYSSFKGLVSIGYFPDPYSNVTQGSVSDSTVDFINNGNATFYLYHSNILGLVFIAYNIGTDNSNSGFTSIKVHNTTFTRASAGFEVSAPSYKQWRWSNVGNVWDTTTSGTIRTVEFN